MNFVLKRESIKFKDCILLVNVIYDEDQEYLPRVNLDGIRNLHHPIIKDWNDLMVLANSWIDKGYWRQFDFSEFCERVFSDD